MSSLDDFFDSMEEAGRPVVKKFPWMEKVKFELVTTETLSAVIDACIASGEYALDLEATGLNNRVLPGTDHTEDIIVGICLAPNDSEGYYIPVRHINHMDKCVPGRIVHAEMSRLIKATDEGKTKACFHNGKFDHELLQFNHMGPSLGLWDDPKVWDDSLILAYLRDTKMRQKGLKYLSKTMLGMEMLELDNIFTKEEEEKFGKNFGVLDPSWEPCVWYACSDAVCTLRLVRHLRPLALDPTPEGLPSQKAVYDIEKLCVAATRWMERCRIPVSREKVRELMVLGVTEWLPALQSVYREASVTLGRDVTPGYVKLMSEEGPFKYDAEKIIYLMDYVQSVRAEASRRKMDLNDLGQIPTIPKRVPKLRKPDEKVEPKGSEEINFPVVYDILIPESLGAMLRELGVPGLNATEKSGQVQTSKDILNTVIENAGDEFAFVGSIKRFREVAKALASNLEPLYKFTSTEPVPKDSPDYKLFGETIPSPDGRIRVNFDPFKTDTARFSTPADKGDRFHGKIPWNLHSIPSGNKKGMPDCAARMREVIRVPLGWLLFAIDFSGEELRIVSNLSGEPLWINEFFRCSDCDHRFDRDRAPPPFCPKCGSDKIGDVHTLTALAIYGQEILKDKKLFKEKRGSAKGVNFGLCYGGSGRAVVRATGCADEEGHRIKRQFDKNYTVLAGWWAQVKAFARKTKHVLTAFNRRYPLPDIDHENKKFVAQAERNAVNAPVQATGADIMKLAMGLIYREVKKQGWFDCVRMIVTIHDELVFEVREDMVAEVIPVIQDIMVNKTIAKLRWTVPLTTDTEFGQDWTVPYNITHMLYGKAPVPAEWQHIIDPMIRKLKGDVVETPVNETPAAAQPPSEAAPASEQGGRVQAPPEAKEVPPDDSPRPVTPSTPPVTPMPEVVAGDVFVYRINSAILTMKTASRLSKVVIECAGRGTNPLRVEDDKGNVIFAPKNLFVNPMEFTVLMNRRGSD